PYLLPLPHYRDHQDLHSFPTRRSSDLANKINEPLLMIHGEADDNSGTFPIQSERMYQAVRGNGGTVRLVMLPLEAHGYAAHETIDRKSTRLNSSHSQISYAVFCLKKKK